MQRKVLAAKHILTSIPVPPLPEELIQLQEELTKKYPNTVTIANLISHNPELLSDFLELVNANLSSNREPIKEARAAVNTLGLNEIFNLYMSATITDLVAQTYSEKQILQHGAKAGIAAAELSYWVQDVSRSEAYFAALTQNIGAIFMARYAPDKYFKLFEQQNAYPTSKFAEEERQFGTNHNFVGALVTKKWKASEEIVKAILLHHDLQFADKAALPDKVKKITALVILSNYIVSSVLGENYLTQEMKEYRNSAQTYLKLPDNANSAAIAAVSKWGSSIGIAAGTH